MADRIFTVGETVHLRVRVSRAGTKTPATPTQGVTLRRFSRDGVAVPLPDEPDFAAVVEGLYELVIQTEDMEPGTYSWLAAASNGPTAVSQAEDTFVLAEPSTAA